MHLKVQVNKYPPIKFTFHLPEHVRNAARFRERPLPSKWAEDNWMLTKVYARKGKFKPYAWQRYVIDLIQDWTKIYIVAPVRMGKTMISDIMRGYCTDIHDMGGTVIYPNHDLVRSNFKTRILPTFKEVPVMRKHLTGKEDDLTIQQIILKNAIWNTASAQNKNHLAQYGAQFIQGDEVSKWRFVGFDPDALIDGRQKDYIGTTNFRKVYSSSPWEVGDMYYKAIYRPETLIITPHALCPWCHVAFEWSDYHIKENLPKDSKLRKDPIRIATGGEGTVIYECPHCGKEIPEDARYDMIENTVWAAPEIDTRAFKQKADLINPDGTIIKIEDRNKKSIITVNWNRLLDYNWKFYDCLSAFFKAQKDPKAMRAYQTEDMARFYNNAANKKSSEYILAKRFGYLQYGPEAYVPEGVLVVVCSVDTQDNGFYIIHRGYGIGMETWLIRHEFVEAPMNTKAKNKDEVLKIVRPELEIKLQKKNGEKLTITFGLIDRGGHMSGYVDYLCDHILWLHSYVGNETTIDLKKKSIEKSKSKEVNHRKLYIGQTRMLSDAVSGRMENKLFHMPDDVTEEYIKQLLAQYYEKEIKPNGEEIIKYVKLPYDHMRDCENYCEGCVEVLGLEDKLHSEDYVRKINEHIGCQNRERVVVEQTKKTDPKPQERRKVRSGGGWLDTIRSRR